jgi:YVTN family beta-propeller protein
MISIKKMKRFSLLCLFAALGATMTSCEKNETKPFLPYDLTHGVAIANEGTFQASNASLSIYYPEGDSVVNDVFSEVNDRPLGDVLQSIGFSEENAYFVMNASNKIEVVNKKTCVEVATISDLGSPRYIIPINNQKVYVTLWGDEGKVGVIDIATSTLTKQITVGSGPEKMILLNGKVFVANCGGWGTDNKVSVINSQTDEVTNTIIVADNPKDFVVDKNGKIWVLCSGNVTYGANPTQTNSKLMMINPSTNSIEKTIDLGESFHPSHLEINPAKDALYYGGDFGVAGIFSVSITATDKATSSFIDGYFYGFNVDPASGIIYGLQAPSYTSAGTLKRYSSAGSLISTSTLGIVPNGAYFAD